MPVNVPVKIILQLYFILFFLRGKKRLQIRGQICIISPRVMVYLHPPQIPGICRLRGHTFDLSHFLLSADQRHHHALITLSGRDTACYTPRTAGLCLLCRYPSEIVIFVMQVYARAKYTFVDPIHSRRAHNYA